MDWQAPAPTKVLCYALAFAGSLILAFHLFTFRVPAVDGDEAALVNCSLYGRLALWDTILPENLHGYEDLNCYMAQRTGQRHLNTFLVRVFGVGVFQARFFFITIALVSLCLYVFLAWHWHRLEGVFGLLFYSIGWNFLVISHNDRPEAVLSLFIAANLLWFFKGWTRGVLPLGFGIGLMWAFHEAIVFFFALLPALIYYSVREQPNLDRRRWRWWALGMLLGMILAWYLIDFEKLASFLHLMRAFGNDYQLPLLKSKWDLTGFCGSWLSFLFDVSWGYPNFSYRLMVTLLLAVLLWQGRRYAHLKVAERAILIVSASFLIEFLLGLAYPEPRYQIYVLPWLWMNFFVVMRNLWTGIIRLDALDFVLLAVMETLPIWISGTIANPVGFGVLVSVFWTMIFCVKARPLFTIGTALILGALVIPDLGTEYFVFLSWFWPRHQIVTIAIFLGPAFMALLFFISRKRCHLLKEWSIVVLMMTLVGVNESAEVKKMCQDFRATRLTPQVTTLLSRLKKEPRSLGSQYLWLLAPSDHFQSLHGLEILNLIGYRSIELLIRRYHPTLVLWPKSYAYPLNLNMAGLRKIREWTVNGDVFEELVPVEPLKLAHPTNRLPSDEVQ